MKLWVRLELQESCNLCRHLCLVKTLNICFKIGCSVPGIGSRPPAHRRRTLRRLRLIWPLVQSCSKVQVDEHKPLRKLMPSTVSGAMRSTRLSTLNPTLQHSKSIFEWAPLVSWIIDDVSFDTTRRHKTATNSDATVKWEEASLCHMQGHRSPHEPLARRHWLALSLNSRSRRQSWILHRACWVLNHACLNY